MFSSYTELFTRITRLLLVLFDLLFMIKNMHLKTFDVFIFVRDTTSANQ